MRCNHCKNLPKEGDVARSPDSGPHTLPGWERLQLIMCAHCGQLLPPLDVKDTMLEKIAGLARFGLAAGTPTLLEP